MQQPTGTTPKRSSGAVGSVISDSDADCRDAQTLEFTRGRKPRSALRRACQLIARHNFSSRNASRSNICLACGDVRLWS